MKKLITIFVAILSVSFLIMSCGDSESTGSGGDGQATSNDKGSIGIDGSSTVFPITEAVAEEYRAVAKDVQVTVGVSGTGGGFKKFSRGETDISDASRPIKQKEIDACKENNISYLELSVAYDGLAVIANPENDWLTDITVAELKKIWEPAAKGVVMNWNQIRPEWPAEKIELYGPGTASGTFDYFTEAICGESGACRADYNSSEDDNILVTGVSGNKYALGFFGLAYYEANQEKLKLVAVDGGNGAVTPSLESVKDGSYAPLSRPLFIYVNSTAAAKKHVVNFVNFYLENAGEMAEEVGYIPLKDEEYAAETAKFEEFLSSLSTPATAE
jgi:phosphate transport system substrate-binding protein